MRRNTRYFYPIVLIVLGLSLFPYFPSGLDPSAQAETAHTLHAKLNQKTQKISVIQKIRHSNNKKSTRVVIDLSQGVSYAVTRDPSSQTLLIKLEKAVLGKAVREKSALTVTSKILQTIEATQKGRETVYISLRYKKLGTHKHLILDKPHRLVIDLYPPTTPATAFAIRTIVIDPGHGGKDPGARSRGGLKEKDIALDISKRLKKLLETRLKKKVIMTRDRDVFISLKKRTQIANQNKADLFISVHINASTSRKLKGIEVYLLGRPSDKRAMALAARENAETHKGVIDFEKMILNDLERDFTKKASLELAHFTNDAIKKNLISKYPTKALGVKRAPFYVLNHTDMPAILAEISFLSNRKEEKRLRSSKYRQAAAEALLKGIQSYIRSVETAS